MREGRGRREKGRTEAGGERGARGKNVGTWADARSAEAHPCPSVLSQGLSPCVRSYNSF